MARSSMIVEAPVKPGMLTDEERKKLPKLLDTAQGGDKVVTIEGGGKVSTPLFINEGDIIKINTETGDYVERVDKS